MTLTAQLMVHPPQGRVPVRCSTTATRARASAASVSRRRCFAPVLLTEFPTPCAGSVLAL